jgi:glutamate synthase (NADPH/NADH) small chain
MGKVTGFLEIQREQPSRRKVAERLKDWQEIYEPFPEEKQREQGARCMDCGVPFCHTGCPVNNLIPDWNDLVYNGRWENAIRRLHATNNFPEFTGRICPAPCEAACVLAINQPAVSIKLIERGVVERAWDEGWIHPEPPQEKTGQRVAVVGSGPAGLAAAQQLRRAGHSVTVYEKSDRIGGLLRYGIPNFKLEKHVVDRRLEQMRAEGVTFVTNAHVGVNVPVESLTDEYDAVLLAGGSEKPRDLPIAGRELKGIHFAMEFLPQQNRRCEGDTVDPALAILAEGKRVVILGGGDTGADCLGTVHRQGAASVHQLEIMAEPPSDRLADNPWPLWPLILRTSSAHEEGGQRLFSVTTTEFVDDGSGAVRALRGHTVEMRNEDGRPVFEEVPGSEFEIETDLVLLAMGFVGTERRNAVEELGVEVGPRGTVVADPDWATSVEGVFVCGDQTRGQSLIVWAIAEGRSCAAAVDRWLMGTTALPAPIVPGQVALR